MHTKGLRTDRVIINKQLAKQAEQRYKLGDNLANHMTCIFSIVLYDKCDLTFKQVLNFYNRVAEVYKQWQDDNNTDVTSESLLRYAKYKNIDVTGFINSIPMSQKLYLADIGKNKAVLNSQQNINYAFLSRILLCLPVLKETYRFSNEKINLFFNNVKLYCELYYTKQPKSKEHYCSDEVIRQVFIEEEHYDIKFGKELSNDN